MMAGPLILCVGKLKEPFFHQACNEYKKRLSAGWPVEIVEIAEQIPKGKSNIEVEKAMEKEAEDIKRHIPQGSFIVALCIEGTLLDSPELADRLAMAEQGGGRLVFIIGGSNGLAQGIKRMANLRLSMSKMTFPHHLARVMLLEQLYRSFTIRTNRKYHK